MSHLLALVALYVTEVLLSCMMVMILTVVVPIVVLILVFTIATFVSTIMIMAIVVTIPMLVEIVSSTVFMIMWFLLNGSRVVLTVATTVLPLPGLLLLYIVIQRDSLVQKSLVAGSVGH